MRKDKISKKSQKEFKNSKILLEKVKEKMPKRLSHNKKRKMYLWKATLSPVIFWETLLVRHKTQKSNQA